LGVVIVSGEAMKYFNDDGTEFNPNLMSGFELCTTCSKSDDPKSEMVCNLTRADQQGEKVFVCFAYQPISAEIDRKKVLRKLCQQAELGYTEDDLSDPADDDADMILF
jgi:hypothetical protein